MSLDAPARPTASHTPRILEDEPPARRDVVQDAAILVLLVAISVLPYLGELGFHSDDWGFLATMETASDQSFVGRFEATLAQHEPMRPRPVPVVLQVALHSAFGTRPLGYHVFNAVMLAMVAVTMLLTLRQLRVPRLTAWCVTAVFILLPSYATNRFWFAALGYPVMMATYFFSVVADLRAVEGPSRHPRWGWKAAAIAGLVLCGLGHELAIPFLLASPLLVSLHSRRTHGEGLSKRYGRGVAIVVGGSTYAALAAIVAFKAATSLGVEPSLSYYNVMRLVLGWATVHFGSFGAGLPYTTLWATDVAGPNAALLSVLAAGTAAGWTAHLAATYRLPSLRAGWMRLVLVGLAVYVLGLAIFLTNARFVVTSTGIGNRVGMAAAVGVALVLVGLVFLFASWFPAPAGRNAVVALAIGAICGSCVLVTSAVATSWATAYRTQQHILSTIEDHLPSIPSQATLIVDGVCPYHGPAIVFESDWGLTGALRVAYPDKALRGDVVQSDTQLGPRGLRNRIYIVETFHPYADDLLLFDVRDGDVVSLADANAARRALAGSIARWTERCPAGREGRGVPVLRTDQIYIGWEDRGFEFR